MASDSFSLALMSRVEDAGLNASAPPQQRWLDGWLVRYLPGKARRARCINALAPGLLPLADKLAMAEPVYAEAGLPMIFRLTRFTQPPGLDDELQRLGFAQVDGPAYAEAVGALRGSPPEHRSSHALRLQHSPVPYQGFALVRQDDANVLACGQFAREGELVGLYDVHTHESARGQGLAGLLCERMLTISASQGAKTGYLQVDGANHPALAVYRRLGFAPGYGYHYRERPQT